MCPNFTHNHTPKTKSNGHNKSNNGCDRYGELWKKKRVDIIEKSWFFELDV